MSQCHTDTHRDQETMATRKRCWLGRTSGNGSHAEGDIPDRTPDSFEPSYMPNVTLKLDDGDIAPDSEAQTAFNKYVK
jgi:hypothetical protein